MAGSLDDNSWNVLVHRIQNGQCTPFLGAGACHGVLPLGSEIASEWASKFGYPLEDRTNLIRVAQFVAVEHQDSVYPKDLFLQRTRGATRPKFEDPCEPHSFLASLPLPVYLTTNYDDFMIQALRFRNKLPQREVFRWNELIKSKPSIFDGETHYEPTTSEPLVFHLHGSDEIRESIVLTEDDYFDFLLNISSLKGQLPARIEQALTGSSVLFLGYAIADWDFRVLFRGLVTYLEKNLRRAHVSVQIAPGDHNSAEQRQKVEAYLTRYYGDLNIRVYWGTCSEFVAELKHRLG